MHEPQELIAPTADLTVETIEQHYFTVDQDRKFDLLVRLMHREEPQQAIIFCRTKRGAQRIYEKLSRHFPGVGCMHGDMAQRERDRVMDRFRSSQICYMVCHRRDGPRD